MLVFIFFFNTISLFFLQNNTPSSATQEKPLHCSPFSSTNKTARTPLFFAPKRNAKGRLILLGHQVEEGEKRLSKRKTEKIVKGAEEAQNINKKGNLCFLNGAAHIRAVIAYLLQETFCGKIELIYKTSKKVVLF